MKKRLLTLLFLTIALTEIQAYSKLDFASGTVTQSSSTQDPPKREVTYVNDGIIVSYTFSSASIRQDDLYPNATILEMLGTFQSETQGEPNLPKIVDSFVLPIGSNPTISITSSSYRDFTYELAPARPPLLINDTIGYTLDNVLPITPFTGLLPASVCELQSVETYRSQPVASILASPVQYEYATHKVRIYTNLTYKISYNTPTPSNTISYEPGSLLNPNHKLSITGTPLTTNDIADASKLNEGYLILSVPEFKESLQPFITWKKQLGYTVSAVYKSDWDSVKIKDTVKSHYVNNPNLMYLLIVGDHEKVPAENLFYGLSGIKYYLTDMRYGCMDGDNDLIPDIYRGRWPVRTSQEVENIVEKTIWYERSPDMYSDYYRRGVHVGFFQDENDRKSYPGIRVPDGIEDHTFVKNCEDIRDYLTKEYGFEIQRLYSRDSAYYYNGALIEDIMPKYWKNVQLIPEELWTENGHDWYTDANEINNAINKGCSYVLFQGHGASDRWGLSYFPTPEGYAHSYKSSDIRNLTNRNRFPLIFSITCLTGQHDNQDCMARAFISQKNAGAIGVYAFTRESYINQNNYHLSILFNSLWSKKGFELYGASIGSWLHSANIQSQIPIYNLGKLLDFTNSYKLNNIGFDLYSRRILHCFADPSLSFNTDLPDLIYNVDIDRDEISNSVTVDLGNEPAYISFYDPVLDRVSLHYSTKASFNVANKDELKYVSVVVRDLNKVPYTDMGEIYYGEVSTSSSSHIAGWQSVGGSRAWIDYVISESDRGKSISMVVVDTSTNSIISNVPIRDITPGKKQQVSVIAHSGIMIASLMIDGYPVSNVKMYISQ